MKSFFSFHFYNKPNEDNIIYGRQINGKDDILFDLGDVSKVPAASLLRVRWIFISHTHLDHFSGFPNYLRTILKIKGKEVSFFGPKGFIKNLYHSLSAYTWNLLEYYDITFNAYEVDGSEIRKSVLRSENYFEIEEVSNSPFNGVILDEELFFVKAVELDHKTPVLGFRLEEKNQFAVNKDALLKFGLKPGKWLGDAKKKLVLGDDLNDILLCNGVEMTLGEIKDKLFFTKTFPAHVYLTDFGMTKENLERALSISKPCNNLYIESNFLDEDKENAIDTCHLTAFEAGVIAGMSEANNVKLFHFSQRYIQDKSVDETTFYDEMKKGMYSVKVKEES